VTQGLVRLGIIVQALVGGEPMDGKRCESEPTAGLRFASEPLTGGGSDRKRASETAPEQLATSMPGFDFYEKRGAQVWGSASAMRPSSPFTNRPESSVESSLATSTASLMATATGMSSPHMSSKMASRTRFRSTKGIR